ncbi:MAG: FkbM family methyltransferase [Pseudomonadota bacterium]|nr:FkbM family methyltransferase [Pseudomonadota bacterium]
MPRTPVNRQLIVDIGMSEGNDSDYYLRKGFDVLGIEADPIMYQNLRSRFSAPISEGRMTILNRAAAEKNGTTVRFFRNVSVQGHSRVLGENAEDPAPGDVTQVETIDWSQIVRHAGVPYYSKIDIEGSEPVFLRSLVGSPGLPTYISAEIHTFEPVEMLFQAGYRRFKVINQSRPHLFTQPNPPLEGTYVEAARWNHSSGPFGRELPGNWVDFREAAVLFEIIHQARQRLHMWDWFDVHAHLPE